MRRLHTGLSQAVVIVLVLCTVSLATWGTPSTSMAVVREFAFAVVWLLVGVAAGRTGRYRLGALALTTAIVVSSTIPSSLGIDQSDSITNWVVSLSLLMVPWQTPLVGHMLLTFPTGRLDQPVTRVVIRLAYMLASVETILLATTGAPYAPTACARCATGMLAGGDVPAWVGLALRVVAVAWMALGLAALYAAALRFRRASARQRRLLRVPYAATILSVLVLLGMAAVATADQTGMYTDAAAIAVAQTIALLGMPACFIIGLVRDRMARGDISDFVEQLTNGGLDLEAALRRALRDPSLVLVLRAEAGWVDANGMPHQLAKVRTSKTVTIVADDPGMALAAIVHDQSLEDEPALLTAAGSATRLALENEVMRARIAQQTQELRASRARVIAASDQTRRQIERDLHDGAQQQLVAAGMAVQMARQRCESADAQQLIDDAGRQIRDALQGLRALGAGIYPAALAEQGLAAAVSNMARVLPVPIVVNGPIPDDLAPKIRDAAFFSVSEAVTNALKHARSRQLSITFAVLDEQRTLSIEIIDDGRGGIPTDGFALAGVADRVATVGGSLAVRSPEGVGTRVRIELPCER